MDLLSRPKPNTDTGGEFPSGVAEPEPGLDRASSEGPTPGFWCLSRIRHQYPLLLEPLVPERSDFLEGDAPAAARVKAFLARALEATGTDAPTTAGALVPWISRWRRRCSTARISGTA
jgi:hypothetical protein